MRISQLCTLTGYSPDTIRFYEKLGLLPVTRHGRGFKDYTEWHTVRLLQIKYAKAAGFTLAQIQESLADWVSGRLSLAEQRAILAEQVQKIDQAQAELQVVRRYLEEKIAFVEQSAHRDSAVEPAERTGPSAVGRPKSAALSA